MSQGCGHAVDYLYHYIDDELTWSRRIRIRWHLRRCPNCTGAFGFESRLKSLIQQCPGDEPPPELYDRLRALIREEAARDHP
ncbi:MAG: zf-HC2 domain-containing protein [Acidimicrobiia bacterium]|nr:zf-HC2 domain-containing protein [Acidimicrobiia bacterium]